MRNQDIGGPTDRGYGESRIRNVTLLGDNQLAMRVNRWALPAHPRDRAALAVGALAATVGALAMLNDHSVQYRPVEISLAGQKLLPIGIGLIALGIAWPVSGLSRLRELAVPLAVATAVPILLEPARMTATQPATLAIWALGAVAAMILAVGISQAVPAREARALLGISGILAVVAAAIGIVTSMGSSQGLGAGAQGLGAGATGLLILGGITAVPGLGAAFSRYRAPESDRARVPDAIELAIAGLTPAVAWLTVAGSGGALGRLVPLAIWLAAAAVVRRFAVRPLVQSATRATVQRDMTVAVLEAERTRIAADLHDEALQDLTLLSWRLDTGGDIKNAELARHVGERLRAIVGDLRLPILDDLGTGPALEWLVARVQPMAQGPVTLERSDPIRPPPDVELAFFRVAQEAVSNAIRHGHPPVQIRYASDTSGASLSVDDTGPGITPGVFEQPEEGHYGLLNMRQRAEQIGGLLNVQRGPGGGTRVALDWRTS
jgi:signal transduction histidine kinase